MTRFKCPRCGKLTAGRVPLGGDGSFRYPRKHASELGDPCPGVWEEAEWVDVAKAGEGPDRAARPLAEALRAATVEAARAAVEDRGPIGAEVRFCLVCDTRLYPGATARGARHCYWHRTADEAEATGLLRRGPDEPDDGGRI